MHDASVEYLKRIRPLRKKWYEDVHTHVETQTMNFNSVFINGSVFIAGEDSGLASGGVLRIQDPQSSAKLRGALGITETWSNSWLITYESSN